jgi:RNA polymerase sigma-B factor
MQYAGTVATRDNPLPRLAYDEPHLSEDHLETRSVDRERLERPVRPFDGDRSDQLLREFATTRDPATRNRLVMMHGRIVRYLASRFDSRAVPHEDLVQVGYIGLISAVDRFDPGRGVSFVTYAIPTILGEIKRYFRDQTWSLKAPRRLRELGLVLRQLRIDLEQQLGRPPTIQEIAQSTSISEDRLRMALEVDRAYNPCSLDKLIQDLEGTDRKNVLDGLGIEDPDLAEFEQKRAICQSIDCLDRRQRRIIHLRFYEEMSQAEVARELGISQMHVSRLERQALGQLREMLTA